MDTKYPVTVDLTGGDGNVFYLIGVVRKALRREVGAEAAAEFVEQAMQQESYDGVLRLIMATVEVT